MAINSIREDHVFISAKKRRRQLNPTHNVSGRDNMEPINPAIKRIINKYAAIRPLQLLQLFSYKISTLNPATSITFSVGER